MSRAKRKEPAKESTPEQESESQASIENEPAASVADSQVAPSEETSQEESKPVAVPQAPLMGNNLPTYGLDIDKLPRVAFTPEATTETELRAECRRVLRQVDDYAIKGETGIYASLVKVIADTCYLSTENLGHKAVEGLTVGSDGVTLPQAGAEGLKLHIIRADGVKIPNFDLWKDLRKRFFDLAIKASEGDESLIESLESPSIEAMMNPALRAAALMACGVATIAAFKRGKRLNVSDNADILEDYNPKQHVRAPAVPRMTIQPNEVGRFTIGQKVEYRPNPCFDGSLTYLSAANASVLYDSIFNKTKKVGIDEKTGQLVYESTKRAPKPQVSTTQQLIDVAKEKARRESLSPEERAAEDADSAIQKLIDAKNKGEEGESDDTETPKLTKAEEILEAFTESAQEIVTGKIEIPESVRHAALQSITHLLDSIGDGPALSESESEDVVMLAEQIDLICEKSGIARNPFVTAQERIEAIPDVMKIDAGERQAIFALYQTLKTKVGKLAA